MTDEALRTRPLLLDEGHDWTRTTNYYWTRTTGYCTAAATTRGYLLEYLAWIVFSPPCITALPLSGAGTLFAGTPSCCITSY
mmetsp:Transcript_49159/g.111302  ORF Transcript_49159/g.111302 Transcript_49159/m.111302 type:complete len:82 (+) Transcript_49159:207-452(+)